MVKRYNIRVYIFYNTTQQRNTYYEDKSAVLNNSSNIDVKKDVSQRVMVKAISAPAPNIYHLPKTLTFCAYIKAIYTASISIVALTNWFVTVSARLILQFGPEMHFSN